METRVGIGYDIHRLVRGRKLFLGGLQIPCPKGLLGHSDADVLLHALCDALLGAVGAEDIGELFPDTDPRYQNISSVQLLREVLGIVAKENYEIGNLDTVIIAEEPKLAQFKEKIRENLSGIMQLGKDCVSIKAKTNEGLDSIGRKKAIACYATVLVKKYDKSRIRNQES